MKKLVLWAGLVLAGVLGGVAAAGFIGPRDHSELLSAAGLPKPEAVLYFGRSYGPGFQPDFESVTIVRLSEPSRRCEETGRVDEAEGYGALLQRFGLDVNAACSTQVSGGRVLYEGDIAAVLLAES